MGKKPIINQKALKLRYAHGKTSQADNARYFGVTRQAIHWWFKKLGFTFKKKGE